MAIDEEKTSKVETISPEMIRLFLKEFGRDLTALKKAVEKGERSDAQKAIQRLLGSLKIVHLEFLIPKVKALESLDPSSSIFHETLELLSRIALAKPESFFTVIQNLQRQLLEKDDPQGSALLEVKPKKKGAAHENSLTELFLIEVESQVSVLNEGLLSVESGSSTPETFQFLMRAAHSLKGAARVVNLEPVVTLGHAMEDCFLYLESHSERLSNSAIDILLEVVDFFAGLIQVPKEFIHEHLSQQGETIAHLTASLVAIIEGREVEPTIVPRSDHGPAESLHRTIPTKSEDRVLRVSTKSVNSLMGLAGESMVESLWLQPFGEALTSLKQIHAEMAQSVDQIRESLKSEDVDARVNHYLGNLHHHASVCQQTLDNRLSELEMFIRRHSSLSERLYGEVIDIRMRPLSEGVKGFPRIVRDLGRDLGKKVRLEILGKNTPVDRDILEKLETPLMHLIRNAVDHGIESPEERIKSGKPEEGVVTLEASHRSGMLYITVKDDGRGVELDAIRKKVTHDKIVAEEVVENLTETEILDFLFLPGFSTSRGITEISGRGVGLNIVQNMVQEVGGTIRASTEFGRFLRFDLQLPLTLSVIRALMVEIAGEPYAFPLARIMRAMHIDQNQIEVIENRQYFRSEGKNIGLVYASQVLSLEEQNPAEGEVPVVILSDHMNFYGVIVDKFLGEKDLVVQDIDPLLGKMPGISSGAFMENGAPLLIFDVEDILRSIDKLLYQSDLRVVKSQAPPRDELRVKRVLVVDDSITVREVECRLLQNKGYKVQTAVDGVDGWNAIRIGQFDLVVTDVDMPRMNGIDLVRSIKSDPKLKNIPVMIVSYKDREEDRKLGLEAGADYYLTKASFHDETLVDEVINLIGPSKEEGEG